ncbi:MAG: zinc metallopeptidase [Akkermansia sp.]
MIEFLNIDILSYYVQNAETAPQHSYTIYWIILLGSMLLSWLVSARMKSRFNEYSQIPIPMTGREVAEQMLKDNHITDVKVTSTPGHLTDHYNPADKTVNLSESVYNSNSIAAAAVAAHEVGHAVQHAQAYHWLGLRSALVPVVQLSSNLVGIVLMIGIVLLVMGGSLGIGTGHRPVRRHHDIRLHHAPGGFDASARALKWLDRSHLMNYFDHGKAKSALFWAAMTYVVGALSSLAMLLYYVFIFMNARGRN